MGGPTLCMYTATEHRQGEGGQVHEQIMPVQAGGHWDDAKGEWLQYELVEEAREEEMQYVRSMVWTGRRPPHIAGVIRARGPSCLDGRIQARVPPPVQTLGRDGWPRNATPMFANDDIKENSSTVFCSHLTMYRYRKGAL